MALLPLMDSSLVGRANRPALESAGHSWTFGELEARSNRMARVLTGRGLGAGSRLAYYLANRVEIIDLWIAAVKLGLVLVPVNVLYRERELKHILGDSDPAAMVASRDLAQWIPAGVPVWDIEELAKRADAEPAGRSPVASCGADAPIALIYTSGTTGLSKGAILTQGNFAFNGATLAREWRFTEDDRHLAFLPLFHVHGLANSLHCWLFSGCHMRLEERFDHQRAQRWLEEYRPTVLFGVPTVFVRLVDIPEGAAREIGRRLRLAVSGSAPLAPETFQRFQDRYGTTILERYGMTETLMNVGNPYAGERRPGTVGLPIPGVEIEIRDESGAPVAPGQSGELWVRGPNVCAGYWRRPDATQAAWRDGWFRTGDVGVRGKDGYITLHGRRSDLIISGGFNIYPREIEELLAEQPGIREAAVVGAKDPVRGEVPVAYLVIEGKLDEEALRARLAGQLASFKLPRAFIPVESLPRTALGKIQKHALPAWKG